MLVLELELVRWYASDYGTHAPSSCMTSGMAHHVGPRLCLSCTAECITFLRVCTHEHSNYCRALLGAPVPQRCTEVVHRPRSRSPRKARYAHVRTVVRTPHAPAPAPPLFEVFPARCLLASLMRSRVVALFCLEKENENENENENEKRLSNHLCF